MLRRRADRRRDLPVRLRALPGRLRSLPVRLRTLPRQLRSLPGRARTVPGHLRATPRRLRAVLADRRSRRRVLAVVVVVAVVASYGLAYRSARVRLDDRRDQLADTRSRLAGVRDDLARTADEQAATDTEIGQTRSAITTAVDERTVLDAATEGTWADVAAVEEQLATVNTSRYLVGAHAGTVRSCLDAVSRAVGASRDGDVGSSIDALGAAADDCAETLAYTSGARFAYDFADPFVLRAGDVYYAYSTNSGAGDIQVVVSSDLTHWELVGNALGALPDWAAPNATWAPAVLARGGSYVAYYTVRDRATGRQCISRAVSSSPAGPFLDDSNGPLVCDFGGSIDPSPYVDGNGRAYLLWKSERFFETPPVLRSQELTTDGRGLVGQANVLMGVDRYFEHGVVEAPTMVQHGGRLVVLYAAGDWSSRSYSTAYAVCVGPYGPCLKPPDGRILASGQRLAGPGGAEVFRTPDGALQVAFHAYAEPRVGYPSNRYLHVAPLLITPTAVSIDAAT